MEREEWLGLELTEKLIKQIKIELTSLAVNASKGNYANPQNSDVTQFYNGVASGNVGAYQKVLSIVSGEIDSEEEPDKEVAKEYES